VKAFVLFLLFSCYTALGEQTLSLEQINERIEELKGDTSEETASAVWEEAAKLAQDLILTRKLAAEHQAEAKVKYVPAELTLPPPLSENAKLADHTERFDTLKATIDSVRARTEQLTSKLDQSATKYSELTELIAKARNELVEVQVPTEVETELATAQQQRALIRKEYLEAVILRHQAEQTLLRVNSENVPVKISRRKKHLSKLEAEQTATLETIGTLRKKETQSTRDELEQSSEKLSHIPALAALIEEIHELNEMRTGENGLQIRLENILRFNSSIDEIRKRINEQETDARQRITLLEEANLGIDTNTGLLLRDQRSQLPGIAALTQSLKKHSQRDAQTQITIDILQSKLRLHPPLSETELEQLLNDHPKLTRPPIEKLFAQRKTLLSVLIKEHNTLGTELSNATLATKSTINEIKRYSTFLDQRLFWIKSAPTVTLREPVAEWKRVLLLVSPSNVRKAWAQLQNSILYRLPLTILLIALFLFPVIRRRPLIRIIQESGESAARRNCTSIGPTLKTIIASALLAFSIPSLCFLIAALVPSPTEYQSGFTNLGIFLFSTGLLLKFTRKGGLFEAHFRFPTTSNATIYRNIAWVIIVLAPFSFLIGALTANHHETSAGRLTFIIAAFPLTYFYHRIFRPSHSVITGLKDKPILSRGLYLLATVTPIVFAIGAALGYFASVLSLRKQAVATLGVIILSFFAIQFFTRWILVSRRRLAIAQALRRREAVVAEREANQEGATEKAPDIPSLEEVKAEAVNPVEVQEQTTKLLRLGTYLTAFSLIWAIWIPTLPALSVLDEIKVWGTPSEAQQAEKAPSNLPTIPGIPSQVAQTGTSSGGPSSPLIEELDDGIVSLQDLLLSIVFFTLTFISARNIPGLLSLTLFNRINLGPGGNFALTTTVRYLIVFVGVVIGLGTIGITWAKVQWLAAAITLGIGFGLQEIFANFVAGIILLFERPIRLGDVVTVGNVSGRVSQINIRATTIQQFNNRELLVPNKEFITTQLINWTLRDSVLRFEVPVGIAYGSDTKQATEILNSILEKHPKVLRDPKPDVLFVSFGNSTLDFNLRGYVGAVDDLLETQSQLHYQIDDAFREADIEIAFPQQDIHIRSLPSGTEPILKDT